MAELKQYGYYVKGNKIAIVERDTTFDNDLNSKDFGPGSDRAQWKSPLSSITDGLEFQYVYSPVYKINDISDTNNITSLTEDGSGKIRLTLESSVNFNKGDYIVIKGHKTLNGPHEIAQDASASSLFLTTKYNEGVQNFSSSVSDLPFIYQDVSYLSDEDSEIDLPEYLSKALVDYVKAKLAEEVLNIEAKEYFMKEFRKKVEKFNNTRVSTMRVVAPGSHAIR
tara:strand:- start:2193 stop:2864 length:672 start_codon:yes stop_codon:yes gene_type:complete